MGTHHGPIILMTETGDRKRRRVGSKIPRVMGEGHIDL